MTDAGKLLMEGPIPDLQDNSDERGGFRSFLVPPTSNVASWPIKITVACYDFPS